MYLCADVCLTHGPIRHSLRGLWILARVEGYDETTQVCLGKVQMWSAFMGSLLISCSPLAQAVISTLKYKSAIIFARQVYRLDVQPNARPERIRPRSGSQGAEAPHRA